MLSFQVLEPTQQNVRSQDTVEWSWAVWRPMNNPDGLRKELVENDVPELGCSLCLILFGFLLEIGALTGDGAEALLQVIVEFGEGADDPVHGNIRK